MLIRSLFICSLLTVLSACSHHQSATPAMLTSKSSHSIQKTTPIMHFHKVDVKGQINVNLHTGYKKPSLTLYGDPLDLEHVKIQVLAGRLCIELPKDYPKHGAVTVDIKGQYLNAFSYKGAGLVKGRHLRSSALKLSLDNNGKTILGGQLGIQSLYVSGTGETDLSGISSRSMQIITKGKPNIRLNGKANLTSLTIDGGGTLAFYWLDSPSLTVRAHGCATTHLAGITDRLNVELWGCSKFKGRFLRAKRSFVKTHDVALAEITTLNKQHSLARDGSDIYYYKKPNMQTDFMAYDGAVLDMRKWLD